MRGKIKHTGTIRSIEGNHISVDIIQISACASCTVASHCNVSESKEKVVDIYDVADVSSFHVGDKVTVYASGQVGMNAVLLAFGVPFIVLLVCIYLSYQLTANELVSAAVGIVSLAVYYILLFVFRRRLNDSFAFYIEPYNN